jgi:two-component system, OmpR family, sensor histidine kinase KdpD
VTDARTAWRWAGWIVALALLTVAMTAVQARLDKAHIALAYLLVVLGASAAGGRALGLTIASVAFVAFNFLFLPPYHALVVTDPLDWIVLVTFLATSAVATQLLYRATSTAAAATQRAEEVDRLAALGAETLSAPGAEEALQAIAAVIRSSTAVDACEVYRRGEDGALARVALAARDAAETAPAEVRPPGAAAPLAPSRVWEVVSDESLLGWAAQSEVDAFQLLDGTFRVAPSAPHEAGDARGRLTSLSRVVAPAPRTVRALLLPLVVRAHTVGVLRIASADGILLTPEQARLLLALAYYAALGVERVRLVESAERAEAERRVESLRSALLVSLSHDLRTPLTTIKGIAHEVAHGGERARAAVIEAEADRLDQLVGDLLDLSRIHAGAVRSTPEVNTADELIGAALERAAGPLRGRAVEVDVPPDTLLAGRFDFTQALRALVNLLDNAAKYAPPETPIAVRARRDGDRLAIAVLDRGPGLAPAERDRVFDPFYRPAGTPAGVRGTGLGLSIARGLAEAQGGTVRHEPRPGGGSAFVLELPAADAPEET